MMPRPKTLRHPLALPLDERGGVIWPLTPAQRKRRAAKEAAALQRRARGIKH